MRKRLIQVFGFLTSSLGWLFVLCTMAMDFWRISQIGGQGGSFIIKVAWYWSNLWKDCYTDSTAVTNCRDYPVLWSVASYVQGVRGLLMCGLTLGFFAVVCCFAGMECTYIGGGTKTKDKFLLAGSVFHFLGGVSDISGYCLYINRVARNAFNLNRQPGALRYASFYCCWKAFNGYDLGNPIFLGLVGSFLILFGAILYAITVFRVVCPKRTEVNVNGTRTYIDPRARGRSLYTGYYRPSRLQGTYYGPGRSNSSRISNLSRTTPERLSQRDAFV